MTIAFPLLEGFGGSKTKQNKKKTRGRKKQI
jgi:hypothetical protein